ARMELGLEFDDSDFAEKMKEKPELKSYNANICYQQWFLSEKAEQGKNDLATLNKFRADFYYMNGKFEEAVACYIASLENLSSQNKSMRREVQESLIRCYLQTGQLRQAEEGLEQLLEEKIQNLHLKDSVVEAAEQFVRNDLFEDDRLEETESKEQAFSDGAVTVFEFNQRWFLRAKNL
ncbi:CH076-like protein, partial [Mya arenaria]